MAFFSHIKFLRVCFWSLFCSFELSAYFCISLYGFDWCSLIVKTSFIFKTTGNFSRKKNPFNLKGNCSKLLDHSGENGSLSDTQSPCEGQDASPLSRPRHWPQVKAEPVGFGTLLQGLSFAPS